MNAIEVNFDSLTGPSHNYAGLSYGNIASQQNAQNVSNPKAAALQGLEKMHILMQMGIKQAILPPHERPNIPFLISLGFRGTVKEMIQAAWKRHPEILIASGSAAPMWAANAATIAPSSDTTDHKIHLTPANLCTKFHRSHEVPMTTRILKQIFKDQRFFSVERPLPNNENLSDEGAANHTRFCSHHGNIGTHLLIFGRYAAKETLYAPKLFPARQTFEASKATALQNQISPSHIVFAQQHPEAIDAGAFHNDVVSVGNETVFFYHEKAFLNEQKVIEDLQAKLDHRLIPIRVLEQQLPLNDAISSYLFNSQIVTLPDQEMALIAPVECQEIDSAGLVIDQMIQDSKNPINRVVFIDLKQSMQNGGGPACLRLRVVMNKEEIKAVHQGIFLTENLYIQLKEWIEKHYRDRLKPSDLADPNLFHEICQALDELTKILQLENLYPFQRNYESID